MTGEGEAAGDVLTGAVVGATVEGSAGAPKAPAQGACRNCGAPLNGRYCANCGQPARLHRSLVSLGHDILHGVFHFEGKVWRTIPELFFHPGRLTRRYIDGERAKFVSPMALFLFTVFLTFAAFSLTGVDTINVNDMSVGSIRAGIEEGNDSAIDAIDQKIARLETELEDDGLPTPERQRIQRDIEELKLSRQIMQAVASGDVRKAAELRRRQDAAAQKENADRGIVDVNVNTGWAWFDERMEAGIIEVQDNPRLLIYKLKVNLYKFAWALIPLSLPFMWMLFFWRRDVHLYDHAIFVTYSLTFMLLFLMLCALASAAGVSSWIWGTALGIVPPLHLYKQLRGAYGLSRFGAWVRLFVLFIAQSIVLTLFAIFLLVVGVIG